MFKPGQMASTQIRILALALVLISYLYGLDSSRMPTIGDEAVYMEITRVTKTSGDWLPLQGPTGIWNTKPPLLFWQGMLTTPDGNEALRWQYRWPSIIWTFLIATVLFLFTSAWQRKEGQLFRGPWSSFQAPLIAAATYLGFISTYQHGRPFLMHSWEQLGLVVPAFAVMIFAWSWPLAFLTAAFWGVVALYKSFILIFFGGAALFLILLNQQPREPFWRSIVPKLAVAVIGALLIFSIWFWLDPKPDLIFQQFILGENAGKLKVGSYWQGLFTGGYPLTRIWLGSLVNSGIYIFLLVGLVVVLIRQRRALTQTDRSLTIFILAFLILYSVPSQRQENYLLPIMVMWAALLSKYWERIGILWFRLTYAFLLCYVGFVACVVRQIATKYSEINFSLGAILVLGSLFIGALIGLFSRSWARRLVIFAGLGFCLSVAMIADLFAIRVPSDIVREFSNRSIFMPTSFRYDYTNYRFDFPGAEIKGYSSIDQAQQALAQCNIVAIAQSQLSSLQGSKDRKVHFTWPVLRERLSSQEVKDIISKGAFENLLSPMLFMSIRCPAPLR